jgi:hypothetical protein
MLPLRRQDRQVRLVVLAETNPSADACAADSSPDACAADPRSAHPGSADSSPSYTGADSCSADARASDAGAAHPGAADPRAYTSAYAGRGACMLRHRAGGGALLLSAGLQDSMQCEVRGVHKVPV